MKIEKEAAETFQNLPLEEREKLSTILQAFTLGYKLAKTPEKDEPDSLLLKLKQKGLIKDWNYEGGGRYLYKIEIASNIEPDDIPWN